MASSLRMDATVRDKPLDVCLQVASTVARAAWIARCARRVAELADDVELEQARAVAEVLVDDEQLRDLLPEVVAERIVNGR